MQALLGTARLAEAFVRWIVIGTASVMVVATIAQVIFRYFLNYPLGWTEELARIMLIWWVFLAVGLLAAKRALLSVDALLLALPDQAVHAVRAFAHILSALSMGWLTVLGIRLVGLAGSQISPALQIPYLWIYLSLPVGAGFAAAAMLVNGLIDIWRFGHGMPAARPSALDDPS